MPELSQNLKMRTLQSLRLYLFSIQSTIKPSMTYIFHFTKSSSKIYLNWNFWDSMNYSSLVKYIEWWGKVKINSKWNFIRLQNPYGKRWKKQVNIYNKKDLKETNLRKAFWAQILFLWRIIEESATSNIQLHSFHWRSKTKSYALKNSLN